MRRHPSGSVQLLLTASPRRLDSRLLAVWAGTLAPGGFLLLVHTQHRRQIGLSELVASGEQAGPEYWQHVIAFHSSPTEPTALVHTDVLAFRKPALAAPAVRRRTEHREVTA